MSPPILRGTVLFDLDGTLADTCHDLATAACAALTQVGLPAPAAQALYPYGSRGGRGMLRAGWSGPWDEARFQQAFQAFLDHYALHMFDTTALFDGVPVCLQQLEQRGHAWGIVTNKGVRYTRALVAHLGLHPQALVCGDMVPQPKPAADSLLAAAAQLQQAPRHCLYVGDDGKDVAAAAAAGMPSVAALYGYSCRLNDPGLAFADERVAHPLDLLSVLERTPGAWPAR